MFIVESLATKERDVEADVRRLTLTGAQSNQSLVTSAATCFAYNLRVSRLTIRPPQL